MSTRTNIISPIIGGRGTGKTTFLQKELIPSYLKRNDKQKILIVDTFDSPVWRQYPAMDLKDIKYHESGICRIFSSDTNKLLSYIQKYVYNTVLFFEDATKFIGSRLNDDTKMFILDSKQKNIDAFFLFHYITACPLNLIRLSDYLVLFKVNEVWNKSYSNRFPNPDIERVFREVNKNPDPYYKKIARIGG